MNIISGSSGGGLLSSTFEEIFHALNLNKLFIQSRTVIIVVIVILVLAVKILVIQISGSNKD